MHTKTDGTRFLALHKTPTAMDDNFIPSAQRESRVAIKWRWPQAKRLEIKIKPRDKGQLGGWISLIVCRRMGLMNLPIYRQ